MNPTLWLLVTVASLAASGVFAALVQSLRDLSRARLEDLASRLNSPAATRRIDRILDDAEGHAAAMALPRIVSNLVVLAASTLWIAGTFERDVPMWLDLGLGIAFAAVVLWVFGAILPQAVARHAAEPAVLASSRLIRLVYVVFLPARALTRFFDEVVRRLAGRPEGDHTQELEKELLSVVEEAQQEGAVDSTAREMIQAVVRFRDTTVGQIMTPRTEMEAMGLTNSLSDVTATIRRVGHSRIPVYENDLDHIIGIFYVKDLMRWLAGEGSRGGKTFNLRELVRPPVFVPETKTIRELLRELLQKRVHIAVVADEFGGTAGLVTVEDIMEELVGDITDEYEAPEAEQEELTIRPESLSAELDGRAYLDDVNDRLDAALGVELPESEDYDTVGGFVMVTLGRIPAVGETFTTAGLKVTVLAAEPRRVKRVRVEVLAGQPSEPASVDRDAPPGPAEPAPASPEVPGAREEAGSAR
jgi:CBS domain containing-hemolysin-like protein